VRSSDRLLMHDYLWRWDTDWFWCSGAFGLHNPRVRRLWPRRWRRSDVYHRLVGLDQRIGLTARLDRRNGVTRERVIQDIEVPVGRVPDFLGWFDAEVGMRPVWLCPLRLREPAGPDSARGWPSYPLRPGTTYVNVGFWGTVLVAPGDAEGDVNRRIEAKVTELGGHKSLYSDAYYDRETFDSLYGTTNLLEVSRTVDPDGRLTGLYEKAVNKR
jgi:FAD/FMN-containing dehydrogenase